MVSRYRTWFPLTAILSLAFLFNAVDGMSFTADEEIKIMRKKVDIVELKRKYVYAKQLIVRGHMLMKNRNPMQGHRLVASGEKAVKQLKQLEKAYRMVDRGNKLVAAGKLKGGTRLKITGCEVIKKLGAGQFIRLPGYSEKNDNDNDNMAKLRRMYLYARKLMTRGNKLADHGHVNQGRMLVRKATEAIKQLRKLEKGYGMIARGKQILAAGRSHEGKQLMRRGFNIKMALGAGSKIRLPGFETMNAFRHPPTSDDDVAKLRKMYLYARKLMKRGNNLANNGKVGQGRALVRKATKAIKQLRRLEEGYGMIARGKKFLAAGRKREGKLLMHRGFNIKMSLGAGSKIRLPGFETMNTFRRPPPPAKNDNDKNMSKLRAMYLYARKLMNKGNKLANHGRVGEGRRLVRKAAKAVKQLRQLEKGYSLITRGKQLLAAGRRREGKLLMHRGFNIKMSLGSGSYIRLPGFETMNAFRFPPPPTSTAPRLVPPPSDASNKLHLEYTTSYPKTCACKLAYGLNNGICYETMGATNINGNVRACKKRTCKASYVCVVGMTTRITCIRKKKRSKRAVPSREGFCHMEDVESYSYVPYAI